jgi:hypothetical protein
MTHAEGTKPEKKREKPREPVKLTDKSARTLSGPPNGEKYVIHWDGTLMGFSLRITQAGARSFILNYRTADGTQPA